METEIGYSQYEFDEIEFAVRRKRGKRRTRKRRNRVDSDDDDEDSEIEGCGGSRRKRHPSQILDNYCHQCHRNRIVTVVHCKKYKRRKCCAEYIAKWNDGRSNSFSLSTLPANVSGYGLDNDRKQMLGGQGFLK